MNILVVDDDVVSADGIVAIMPWAEMDIDNVYKAYSMRQAQAVFRSKQVDILLCDIEMPKGTGINLIEWVRKQNMEPVCIFLTCYSSFEYASHAVRLQMFNYVLKPCENLALRGILEKAVEQVRSKQAKLQKEKQGEYWNDNYQQILVSFWEALLNGSIPSDRQHIHQSLQSHHLDSAIEEDFYYVFLLHSVQSKETINEAEWEWFRLIQAQTLEYLRCHIIIKKDPYYVMLIKSQTFQTVAAYEAACNEMITALGESLPGEFFGYFTAACPIESVRTVYQNLQKDVTKHYALQSAVFCHERMYSALPIPVLSEKRWENSLLEYNIDRIIDDIRNTLVIENHTQYISYNHLQTIYHTLLRSIFYVLDLHSLPMNQPFLSEEDTADEHIFLSVSIFMIWVEDTLSHVIDLIANRESSSTIISQVKQYIHENINGDLSRMELAKVAHLHPDYLSTLFRQTDGCSLSEYITSKRILAAKKLLQSTDLPIHEIAIRTGFQSISYFSKQFRHLENMTPNQYRKSHENATGYNSST